MNYDKLLLDKIYDSYYKAQLGYNDNCKNCQRLAIEKGKELVNGPIPITHVGKDFQKSDRKLLIIGLVVYGWADETVDFEEFISSNDLWLRDSIQSKMESRVEELFFSKENRFYSFLNSALSQIYGTSEVAYNSVAISNLVHCNNDEVRDNLPQIVRTHCCSEVYNRFFLEEINILAPKNIVVLTKDYKYTRYIEVDDLENINVVCINHPSSTGNSYLKFKDDMMTVFEGK